MCCQVCARRGASQVVCLAAPAPSRWSPQVCIATSAVDARLGCLATSCRRSARDPHGPAAQVVLGRFPAVATGVALLQPKPQRMWIVRSPELQAPTGGKAGQTVQDGSIGLVGAQGIDVDHRSLDKGRTGGWPLPTGD